MSAHPVPDTSAPDLDTASSHPADHQNTKKRKAASSSRGVSSLTPEQLAKKRANDREAQRAIRERTKAQIEGLERRIEELTSQQPYQELQAVLHQKELIQAENEDIKKRLASVLSIIQPILGIQDSAAVKDQSGLSLAHSQYVSGQNQLNHCTRSQSCSESSTLNVDVPSPSNTSGNRQDWDSPQEAVQFNERNIPQIDFQRNNPQHSFEFGRASEWLPLNILVDRKQHIAKVNSPAAGLVHYAQSNSRPFHDSDYRFYSTPPQNIEPTCPLDTILLDFLRAREREAAEGAPSQSLVGPAYPSVSSLLNPEKSVFSHPLSKVFTDVLSKFPDISELPEKVAVLFIMFLVMRWLVKPTKEHFDRLPEWMTPRKSQYTPHPAWIDYLPWPQMRDTIIARYHEYPFENFFVPYTTTLSLNWPYEPADTLLAPSSNSEELTINPIFETHLRNLSNWSLGEAFAKAHPGLAATCRIKKHDPRKKS